MGILSQVIATDPSLGFYHVLKFIVIGLDVLLLLIMIYSLARLRKYRPQLVYNPRNWQKHGRKKKAPISLATPVVRAAWDKVQARLKDGSPDALRLAILEADGAVDEVLKRAGLAGETFADRLGHLKPERYASLDRVWDAHRLRNNLVHTPDFHVSLAKAEEAVAAYEAFLKEVKAL